MTARSGPHEITLSAAWHAGAFGTDLETAEGQSIQIVHRGVWSHGLGPDFQDALILFNGRELRAGGVEMHLRSRGWIDHGHHLDPAYDNVVLHVVSQHDGAETRCSNGRLVPIVEIGSIDALPVPDFASWDWDRVGGRVCATTLAARNANTLRGILAQLGDTRLSARSARIESRLPDEAPGEILWSELLDGLGFSSNREPMRVLAKTVPIGALEPLLLAAPAHDRLAAARGVLLGAAGFLPLSPTESHLAALSSQEVSQLEEAWHKRGVPWHNQLPFGTPWQGARVRPANHPVSRLLAAADLVVSASENGGLLATVLGLVQGERELAGALRDLTSFGKTPRIGVDRALDILASGLLPLAFAIAAHTGDQGLADAAAAHWERLPAPTQNAVTRRAARQVAGPAPLGKIGARGSQGLIHLDTVLCQPRRCFECPVAAAELAVKGL